MYTTEHCPRNETEFHERSSAINCTRSYSYACFPNDNLTLLLEFCYQNVSVSIQKGESRVQIVYLFTYLFVCLFVFMYVWGFTIHSRIFHSYGHYRLGAIVVFCNKTPISVKSFYLAISSVTFVLRLHVIDFQNSIIVLLVFEKNKENDVLCSKFQMYTNRHSVHIAHSSKPLNWALVRTTPQTCIRVKVVAV